MPTDHFDVVNRAVSAYGDADLDTESDELTDAQRRVAQLADDAGVGAWARGLMVGETRSAVRRLLQHALRDSQHKLGDEACGPRADVQLTSAPPPTHLVIGPAVR